jgi:integrase
MVISKREKTKYPGVFFRSITRAASGGDEKAYYIVFKKDGKTVEEKVGCHYADNLTPAKVAGIRAERMEGRRQSRKEKREELQAVKRAELEKCTLTRLWQLYQEARPDRRDWKNDEYMYNAHLAKPFGHKTPGELRTLEIDAFRNKLTRAGKAPQTVKHILGLLQRLIRFGIKKGVCPAPNPSELTIEMPLVDNKKTENMTQEELHNYLNAIAKEPDPNAAAFLLLALATGVRKGALMALRWDDVDFEKGFLTLRGETAKKQKTESIPLSQSAISILNGIQKSDGPFIFPGKDGGQRRVFRKIAERVKKNAGLPDDFRPLHGLRHAFASFIASSGKVDLYTLQKLLTHGSPQMTQRYAHLADEALARAASVADDIFGANKNADA